MSVYADRTENDRSLPITYSINIKTLSLPKRPLTCYITTTPLASKQLNYVRPTICLEKSKDTRPRSTIRLPITYSTSIHVPCHPPTITRRSPVIAPSPTSYHHYHHHHHHYYYHHPHQQQPLLLPSATIKQRSISVASTRPATTSTTTITSPDSSSSPPLSKKTHKNISPSFPSKKQKPYPSPPPPLPSYSALVWNWFHHSPTKTSSHHKGSQSDYSETCRHESPSKRSVLFKLLTSPNEKQSKSKQHRPCFTRKRLESSSSLPNKSNHYHE